MNTYVKLGGQLYPAQITGKYKDTEWGDRASKTIRLTMTYQEALSTFVDGLAWSIVQQGVPYTDPDTQEEVTPAPVEFDNSAYSLAGSITDHRDGTVSVKMGKPTQAELEAGKAAETVTLAAGMYAMSLPTMEDDAKIRYAAFGMDWTPGSYAVGDVRNANGQVWACFQAHDNSVYPDINPDNAAWFTFWRPLHGKTPETARPFVPVQGAHDMYRAGEYMIYTDGKLYRCLSDTNFSPEDYAQAWEAVE